MKSLLLFSYKNGSFGDKFVSEIWHGELILSAKMISCHQSIFFKTVIRIEYAIDCFKSNTTKVRNIKKYLLTTLFNAPSTISGYYQAEVNHDFPQYAVVDK